MSRYYSYINAATTILLSFKPGKPFVYHLKSFFSMHKQMGSKDRRIVSSLCYDYLRCKSLFSGETQLKDALLHSVFICEKGKDNKILALLSPELHEKLNLSTTEKLAFLNLSPGNLFAFQRELSNEIDPNAYAVSFLNQPDLYLRIRPGREKKAFDSLLNAGIHYDLLGENVLKLESGIDVSSHLEINRDVVVQDANSQRVFQGVDKFLGNLNRHTSFEVWDACAASGGKSILIYDLLKGKVKLTVSDVRKNMLHNLASRLGVAGINIFKKFTADLTINSGLDSSEAFDIVVCDVPCTGSGTWARTPEQQLAVTIADIEMYAQNQRNILQTVLPHVSPGGLLIYITCSVFKKENEDVLDGFLQKNKNVTMLQSLYHKGYDAKADTLFSAILKC